MTIAQAPRPRAIPVRAGLLWAATLLESRLGQWLTRDVVSSQGQEQRLLPCSTVPAVCAKAPSSNGSGA